MSEKWFCFVDVKYSEEETYVPRHQKAILWVDSFDEAFDQVKHFIGENLDSISFEWAGKPNQECKQDPFFSESEFDRFELIKTFIEDDKSYADYCRLEEEYERSRKNR